MVSTGCPPPRPAPDRNVTFRHLEPILPQVSKPASPIVAAQAGAEWAWEQIYRALAPQVRGFLAARGSHDPDGLLGDVFLDAARGIDGFEGDESGFRAWVFTIARRRLIDERRRRGRSRLIPLGEAEEQPAPTDVQEAAIASAEVGETIAMLDRLTRGQREVIVLRFVSELSLEETAEVMGKTVGAIKVLQHRAVKRLKHLVEKGP